MNNYYVNNVIHQFIYHRSSIILEFYFLYVALKKPPGKYTVNTDNVLNESNNYRSYYYFDYSHPSSLLRLQQYYVLVSRFANMSLFFRTNITVFCIVKVINGLSRVARTVCHVYVMLTRLKLSLKPV